MSSATMLMRESRRRGLKTLLAVAALPFALQWPMAAGADDAPPLLDENSASGKSLGYVADAAKVNVSLHPKYGPGQSCRNCSQYLGEAGDKAGGCALVLGQFVLADAWCDAWELRPGARQPGATP